ncbi:MAG: hypothetical protein JNL83_25055 [Myxococcales bacterium]|nr:hypothetical protein [Myxococcales bacterium]
MERRRGMKTLTIATTLLALTSLSSLASAEDAPKPIADLERFVGTWKASGTLTMGKDTVKVSATWACKRVSAKAGVGCTLELKGVPGLPVYGETDLFGYEPHSNTYHWFAVTNAGETHDHVAKVAGIDEPKLQFVYTGTQEGKPFKEVIDLTFEPGNKAMALRAETFVAGASTSVFDMKAKK